MNTVSYETSTDLQLASRPWQRKTHSDVDANQAAGAFKKFSAKAKEFVPKFLRGKETPSEEDEVETTPPTEEFDNSNVCEGQCADKKAFPWRTKERAKTVDIEDEDDDESTAMPTSLSSSTCAASTDVSSTPSDHGDVSDAEATPQPVDAVPSKDSLELKVSSTSWAAMRRARRQSAEADLEELSDEEIVRRMKSILNKLTIEKFPVLSKQLACCGIKSSAHLDLLIREVFEKATTQHHFINMYADLCVVLQQHFAEHPISSDPSANLKKILLNACQASFERHLTVPAHISTLKGEEKDAAEHMYKRQMIGNIKLVGALVVRKMLATKVLFAIMRELLNVGMPEALESLAALLTVVGSSFDQPDSPHKTIFTGVFDQIEALSKDTNVKSRVRCLLRDVVELRAAGWQDVKPKKLEGPSKLEDVAQKFYEEAGNRDWDRRQSRYERGYGNAYSRSDWSQGWNNEGSPQMKRTSLTQIRHRFQEYVPRVVLPWSCQAASTPSGDVEEHQATCEEQASEEQKEKSWVEQPKKEPEEQFDKVACNKRIAEAFVAMLSSQNIHQAVADIKALGVPEDLQAEQLCDLLMFIVEATATFVRTLGFQLIAAIYMEGCWSKASLVKGFKDFEGLLGTSAAVQVQDLAGILYSELAPAFTPLLQQGLLQGSTILQVLSSNEDKSAASSSSSSSSHSDSNKDSATHSRAPHAPRRKKKSLIDRAAEQQKMEQNQQEKVLPLGRMVAPCVYHVPSVYFNPPQF